KTVLFFLPKDGYRSCKGAPDYKEGKVGAGRAKRVRRQSYCNRPGCPPYPKERLVDPKLGSHLAGRRVLCDYVERDRVKDAGSQSDQHKRYRKRNNRSEHERDQHAYCRGSHCKRKRPRAVPCYLLHKVQGGKARHAKHKEQYLDVLIGERCLLHVCRVYCKHHPKRDRVVDQNRAHRWVGRYLFYYLLQTRAHFKLLFLPYRHGR